MTELEDVNTFFFRISMIATSIFGVLVICINIFFVVDTILEKLAGVTWAVVLIAVVSLIYFAFVMYLVSTRIVTSCYIHEHDEAWNDGITVSLLTGLVLLGSDGLCEDIKQIC